jgi:D-alanyl-D-alanine dipeptidase
LRTPYLYPLGFCLILAFCERKPEKVKHHLVTRTVFEIPAEIDSSASKKKKIVSNDTSYIEYVFKEYDLVDIKTMDSTIQVNLRYADTNNFLKMNLYDGLRRAYFNCEAAIRVCAAQYYLKQINPDLSLVVLDASRPQHIQQTMWDSLKLQPIVKFNYLSPPDETSLHNYGCAIDVTIMNVKTGEFLDMGTEYDYFGKLAQPIYEAHFLKNGDLGVEAFENRRLLRTVMQNAKLKGINTEWWHFSSCTRPEAIAKYRLIK